jgi:uroporphyrinogen-III synthase
MVFFSPSGVDAALKYMNQEQINKFEFISLGETTKQALLKYNVEKASCAKKPNPESLCDAIDNIM